MLEKELLNPEFDGIAVGEISLESNAGSIGAQNNRENANRNDVEPEDLYAAYRESLTESLEKYGIDYAPDKTKYIIDISILGYKEGNAFVRWLTPAGGESKVTVQATLKRGEKIIGGVESQQTIAWGGGFSIGGWRNVISWSAAEVAEELCRELFVHSPDQNPCPNRRGRNKKSRYKVKDENQT